MRCFETLEGKEKERKLFVLRKSEDERSKIDDPNTWPQLFIKVFAKPHSERGRSKTKSIEREGSEIFDLFVETLNRKKDSSFDNSNSLSISEDSQKAPYP